MHLFYAEGLKNLINNVNFSQKYKNILNFSLFWCFKKGRVLLWEGQKGRVDFPFSK